MNKVQHFYHNTEQSKMPDLPDIQKEDKVIMRLPPEPIGPLHLGNAYAFTIMDWYAHEYTKLRNIPGDLTLRFDDTNPDVEDIRFVDVLLKDLSWLGIRWNRVMFASDQIDLLYQKGRELLQNNQAYICNCSLEAMISSRKKSEPCQCRLHITTQLELYDNACGGGHTPKKSFVLRLLGDLKSPNVALRDPVLIRFCKKPLINTSKYWIPTFELEGPVLDGKLGVNYTYKNIAHCDRAKLHNKIQELLDITVTKHFFSGGLSFEGMDGGSLRDPKLYARFSNDIVNKSAFWENPQFGFIASLKARGYSPDFIRDIFLNKVPFNKKNKTIKYKHWRGWWRSQCGNCPTFIQLDDPILTTADYTGNIHLTFAKDERRYSINCGQPIYVSGQGVCLREALYFEENYMLQDRTSRCGLILPKIETIPTVRYFFDSDNGISVIKHGQIENSVRDLKKKIINLYGKGLHLLKVETNRCLLYEL